MESLEKILNDCQTLLNRRDTRVRREAENFGAMPGAELSPRRFEVLVFESKRKSDLTEKHQPFDHDFFFQSEKKQPSRSKNSDSRMYASEARQPRRQGEEPDAPYRSLQRDASPPLAAEAPWQPRHGRRAPIQSEAPDEIGCSSISIPDDSKLRLSGINTRSHLEFGPSFRLKALQGNPAYLGKLSKRNQKKQRMAKERPASPGLIVLEELSRDQLLQSVSRKRPASQQRNPASSLPKPTQPTQPAPKSPLRFESPERKVVRILQKEGSAEVPEATHSRFAASKKREFLRTSQATEPQQPRAGAAESASTTGNVVINHSSLKPKRSRPLSVQKDRFYDFSSASIGLERKKQSRRNSPSLATTHASVYNIGKMHDYETPHLRQLFAARRGQLAKHLGVRSPDLWPGWEPPEEERGCFTKSGTLCKAFSDDLEAPRQPPRFKPDQTEPDLCRMEAGEESLGFLIRGNGEKYSFQCKKLF